MDKRLQNEAFQEILNTLERMITSSKKGTADKTAKQLCDKLHSMGVKDEEADILLDWAKQKLIQDFKEDEEDEAYDNTDDEDDFEN